MRQLGVKRPGRPAGWSTDGQGRILHRGHPARVLYARAYGTWVKIAWWCEADQTGVLVEEHGP